MENLAIGLRSQDFHESLKVTGVFGPKEVHFKRTLLIGKAASLAMHLRGLLYIEDVQQLEYAAASLGIASLELPAVLRELEELDFVSVVKTGDEIKRVECRVPTFRSGYEDLGERWSQLKPSEVEQAAVATLDSLYDGPIALATLKKSLSLASGQFSMLSDVMKSGQLLSVQTVDGQPLVFTPLAVDGNPSAYLQWAIRFPGDVRGVIDTLLQHQGMALIDPRVSANPVLIDAVSTGVLMPVEVNGATGTQRFIFAPRGGLPPEERTVMDKARAILSCVRYGQSFAQGRSIKYPRAILGKLRDNKRFAKGHPDLLTQYGLLVEKLIGHPIDDGGGRWNFEVDDTAENMKALDIAIEMLEQGESPAARIDLEAQRALLTPTGYLGPSATRPRILRDPEISSDTRAEIIREMAKLARGMSSHE